MWFFNKKSSPKSELSEASLSSSPSPSTTAPPVAGVAKDGSVLDVLRASVARISRDGLTPEDIDVRAHLLDTGYVDSLSISLLLAEIDRRYKVRIDEMQIVGKLCTLEALARAIEARAIENRPDGRA